MAYRQGAEDIKETVKKVKNIGKEKKEISGSESVADITEAKKGAQAAFFHETKTSHKEYPQAFDAYFEKNKDRFMGQQ